MTSFALNDPMVSLATQLKSITDTLSPTNPDATAALSRLNDQINSAKSSSASLIGNLVTQIKIVKSSGSTDFSKAFAPIDDVGTYFTPIITFLNNGGSAGLVNPDPVISSDYASQLQTLMGPAGTPSLIEKSFSDASAVVASSVQKLKDSAAAAFFTAPQPPDVQSVINKIKTWS